MSDEVIYMVWVYEECCTAAVFPNTSELKIDTAGMEAQGWIRTDKAGYEKVRAHMRERGWGNGQGVAEDE